MSGLVNENQAAEFLGISKKTLQSWRQRRTGPRFVKLSNLVRYQVGDLEDFIATHAVEPADSRSADDRGDAR